MSWNAYVERDVLVDRLLGKRWIGERRKPELVHHPVSFHPSCRSAFVEDKGLLQPYAPGALGGVNRPICSCGFPEASCCNSVWSRAVAILPVPWAVKVPLRLAGARKLCD
jgi:hypothetical protein